MIGLKRKYFTYREVCQKSNYQHLLLIEPLGPLKLDCMGKSVDVQKFCHKEWGKEPKYLRGYVNQKMKEVVCELGNAAKLNYRCQSKDSCSSPQKSCLKLKKAFARNLKLEYFSLTDLEKEVRLNCYFTAVVKDDLLQEKLGF